MKGGHTHFHRPKVAKSVFTDTLQKPLGTAMLFYSPDSQTRRGGQQNISEPTGNGLTANALTLDCQVSGIRTAFNIHKSESLM